MRRFEKPQALDAVWVGPRKELSAHGIETLVDSPHVGQNLVDHVTRIPLEKMAILTTLSGVRARSRTKRSKGTAYTRMVRFASRLLEMVTFPRIDKFEQTLRNTSLTREKNGGKGPFGPCGQADFQIDFVSSQA